MAEISDFTAKYRISEWER